MAGDSGSGVKKKRAVRFACCTPVKQCNGSATGDGGKTHSSTEEVHKCQGNYLVSQGYEKISRREFRSPNGGPILILNKKASRSMGGKADRYMRGNRMKQKIKAW